MTPAEDMIYEGSPVLPEVPYALPVRQHVCSLKVDTPQLIPANVWTIVKFPYGHAESYDADNMHAETRNGVKHPYPKSQASGLIYPAHDGPFARVNIMVQWEDDRVAREYRDQLARNPLSSKPDTTATDHRAATPGMQCFTKTWDLFVHPDVPLGLRVMHNYTVRGKPTAIYLTLAEFKLSYWWYE